MRRQATTIVRVLILVALIMSFSSGLAAAALAAVQPDLCAAPGDSLAAGPVVVQGWVINHRELPVDGTRTPTPLEISAVASSGATVAATVGKDGFFQLTLTPDVWDFQMQLPADWDGIIPLAEREGLAQTGCTPLPGRDAPYLILFKIRRVFDITALKWEELASGAVQPGQGWQITFKPVKDPFAIQRNGQTDANGATTATLTPGTWAIYETLKLGWTPVTPATVWIKLDQYAPPGAMDPVIFKNRVAH